MKEADEDDDDEQQRMRKGPRSVISAFVAACVCVRVSAGAAVDSQDGTQQTPLHLAAGVTFSVAVVAIIICHYYRHYHRHHHRHYPRPNQYCRDHYY